MKTTTDTTVHTYIATPKVMPINEKKEVDFEVRHDEVVLFSKPTYWVPVVLGLSKIVVHQTTWLLALGARPNMAIKHIFDWNREGNPAIVNAEAPKSQETIDLRRCSYPADHLNARLLTPWWFVVIQNLVVDVVLETIFIYWYNYQTFTLGRKIVPLHIWSVTILPLKNCSVRKKLQTYYWNSCKTILKTEQLSYN